MSTNGNLVVSEQSLKSLVQSVCKLDDMNRNSGTVDTALDSLVNILANFSSDGEEEGALPLFQSDPELAIKAFSAVSKYQLSLMEAKRRLVDSAVKAYQVLGTATDIAAPANDLHEFTVDEEPADESLANSKVGVDL